MAGTFDPFRRKMAALQNQQVAAWDAVDTAPSPERCSGRQPALRAAREALWWSFVAGMSGSFGRLIVPFGHAAVEPLCGHCR
jgi:hypothetical protein